MYYVYVLSLLGLVRQGQTSSVLDFRILLHTGNINYMTLLYSEMIPVVLLTVNTSYLLYLVRSKGDAVVRALASHQCGPGSNPGAVFSKSAVGRRIRRQLFDLRRLLSLR